MPVYPERGSKTKWRIRVWLNGQKHDQVFSGTKREAVAEEARWRARLEVQDPAIAAARSLTFSEFCRDLYGPHAKLHLGEYTWTKQRRLVAQLMTFFGGLKITSIHAGTVDAYKAQRLADGLRPVSVNNELRVLARVLSFARERKIPVADTRVQQLPERGSRPKLAWTDDEVSRLLACVLELSPAIYDLVLFTLNTGMRKGEAIAARWQDLDLERGFARVWPNEEWQPKNNKPREVPLGPATLAMLEGRARDGAYAFPSSDGGRYAVWPQKQFDRARKAAGLTGGPHTLRHTYATRFLRDQPDLHLLAKVLGHSHAAVTRLYAHLLPDHLERARGAGEFVPVDANTAKPSAPPSARRGTGVQDTTEKPE